MLHLLLDDWLKLDPTAVTKTDTNYILNIGALQVEIKSLVNDTCIIEEAFIKWLRHFDVAFEYVFKPQMIVYAKISSEDTCATIGYGERTRLNSLMLGGLEYVSLFRKEKLKSKVDN